MKTTTTRHKQNKTTTKICNERSLFTDLFKMRIEPKHSVNQNYNANLLLVVDFVVIFKPDAENPVFTSYSSTVHRIDMALKWVADQGFFGVTCASLSLSLDVCKCVFFTPDTSRTPRCWQICRLAHRTHSWCSQFPSRAIRTREKKKNNNLF